MVRARAPRRARPATAPPSPWSFKLRIGSVFQLNQSSSVVGRIDGTTRSFQLDVHGEVNWEAGDHQVRTRLDTIDVIVKTQNTGRWVPASDFLEVESIYQYRRHPQVGPFARVSGKTSVFLGRDLRTNAVRYELPDGMLTSPRPSTVSPIGSSRSRSCRARACSTTRCGASSSASPTGWRRRRPCSTSCVSSTSRS